MPNEPNLPQIVDPHLVEVNRRRRWENYDIENKRRRLVIREINESFDYN